MATPLVTVDSKGLADLTAQLTALGREAPEAILRAISRTRTTVLTRLLRWLTTATGVPQARLRKSIRATRATRGNPTATITLYGGRVPLIKLRPDLHQRYLPPGGFRQRMPASGHVGFFERMPGARHRRRGEPFAGHALPIKEILSPPFVDFLTQVGLDDVQHHALDTLRKNIEHEIAFRLGRRSEAPAGA